MGFIGARAGAGARGGGGLPPIDSLDLDLHLCAAYGWHEDTGNAEAGAQIDVLCDMRPAGHHASQSTDNKQGTITYVDAAFDNRATIDFDGTADCMSLSAGAGWPSGTSHTFCAVFDQDNATGTNQKLFEAQSGLLTWGVLTATAGTVGFYDSIWRDMGAAVAGPQCLALLLDDSGGVAYSYRNGVFVGEATYGAPHAVGGNVALFSNHASSAAFFDGKLADFAWKAALMPEADLWTLNEYTYDRYPSLWTHSALGTSVAALVVPGALGKIDHEAYLDVRYAANVEKDGSNNCGALLDLSVSREPLGEDMDMEDSGTSAWSLARGLGALSKETGTPYEGSRCLRVTYAASWEAAEQDIMTAGHAFRAKGQMRSDGTATPVVHDGSAQWWAGTTSASWQAADAVAVAANTKFRLRKDAAAGNYIEADAFSLIRCCDFIQTDPAKKPEFIPDFGDGLGAVKFTASSEHHMTSALVANASEGTILIRVWVNSLDKIQGLIGSYDGTDRCAMRAMTTGKLEVGVGANVRYSDADLISPQTWVNVGMSWKAGTLRWYVNGDSGTGSYTGSASTRALMLACRDWNGVRQNHLDGCIRGKRIVAYEMTAEQMDREFELMAA